MNSPGVANKSVAARHIQIGRLSIHIATVPPTPAPGRELADGVGDPCYLLVIPLTGPLHFNQSSRSGVAKPGEYVLLSRLAYYELSSDGDPSLIYVRIPAAELRGRLACVDDHVGRRFSANEHMTRLLVGLIRGVADIFADRPPPNPEALATEIVSFVVLAIGAENLGAVVDVRNGRYHLRRRIFDYIETHLGDQDLSPKAIAASSRISLSYLYSLFSDDDTTVGQFVQLKRLQRAYEWLVADQSGHRTVSEVAYGVGFRNVSHFSRAFNRQFGMSPRDARRPRRLPDSNAKPAPETPEREENLKTRGRFKTPALQSAYYPSLREAV
jgi:AraC-like DNA-binding protein